MPDFPYVKNRDWVNKSEGWVAGDPTADALWFERTETAIHQGQDHEKLVPVNPAAVPTDGQALVWDPVNNWYTPAAVAAGGGGARSSRYVVCNRFQQYATFGSYNYYGFEFSPAVQGFSVRGLVVHHTVAANQYNLELYRLGTWDKTITFTSERRYWSEKTGLASVAFTGGATEVFFNPPIALSAGVGYEIGLSAPPGSTILPVCYVDGVPVGNGDVVMGNQSYRDNTGSWSTDDDDVLMCELLYEVAP